MKKNVFIAAAAAIVLTFSACQKDNTIVPDDKTATQADNTGNTTVRVKSTSDLHNTNWTYSVTSTELINNLMGTNIPCMDSTAEETYVFGLNFDGQYAHFSFPSNIEAYGGDEGELNQITGVSYEYTYDGATHTGYLDGVADDENDNPGQLQFTYDDATDVITFNLNMFYAEDSTPLTLTLNFARNE